MKKNLFLVLFILISVFIFNGCVNNNDDPFDDGIDPSIPPKFLVENDKTFNTMPIAINWENVKGMKNYKLYYKLKTDSNFTDVKVNGTNFNFKPSVNGVYEFRVKYDKLLSSGDLSDILSINVNITKRPTAPMSIAAVKDIHTSSSTDSEGNTTVVIYNRIKVNWSEVSNASHYIVSIGKAPLLGGDITSAYTFTVEDKTNINIGEGLFDKFKMPISTIHKYECKVKAVNPAGESDFSEAQSVRF